MFCPPRLELVQPTRDFRPLGARETTPTGLSWPLEGLSGIALFDGVSNPGRQPPASEHPQTAYLTQVGLRFGSERY